MSAPIAPHELCDFCGERPIAAFFRATPSVQRVFHMPGVAIYHDDGEWDGCAACTALVRSRDREGLVLRSMTKFRPAPDITRDDFERFVRELHGIFWQNFIGEAPTVH